MTDSTPKFRYTAKFADTIEPKWQQVWESAGVHRAPNPGEPGFDPARPKYYALDMFPYPSGAGLHVGHPEGYTATDILSRYKRMRGFAVLHPMGWDAFGLPAEQYAIQTGVHPAITTRKAIDTFRAQLQRFGFSYDWSRELGTIDETYYRWTQWVFLQLYDSWFDPAAPVRHPASGTGRARPIAELRREFESGARPVRYNPRADEVDEDERTRTLGEWSTLDAQLRTRVLNSYRLAYLGETTVNWCPKLGTVLANDEVIDGKSERGGYPVLRKPLRQWMFRITAYAERLLDQLETLSWPASTKTMQREWIGRSEGAEVEFAVEAGATLTVFTTRPDTLFGATFMVVAPEHPLCDQVLAGAHAVSQGVRDALRAYVQQARNRSDVERQESKEKTGVFTGVFATNPATGARIPVWTADYVLMGYGSGAIMAVPAHDERDFAFAKKYDLPIVDVVQPPAGVKVKEGECFSGEGTAINSAGSAGITLTGLPTQQAKAAIITWLESKGLGRKRVQFRLRDWTFSRQRYWGEPFPIVFDDAGNHYPVRDSALPVKLPELADYAPIESQDPQPLLAKATTWVRTTAGEAGVDPAILPPGTPVTRETNTMPGSAGSSWYAIRYCDPANTTRLVSREAEAYWMGPGPDGAPRAGVDLYMGGSEHAVGHLLYARFWQSVLFDLNHVTTPEPFRTLFHQGMITSFAYQRADKTLVPVDQVREESEGVFVETATGAKVTQIVAKMSKSLRNVINPDDVIAEYGADTFRLYEMAMGPLEASKPWNPRDIAGCYRFLQRAWRLLIDEETGSPRVAASPSPALERLLHRAIDKVGKDIERLAFNTAIAALIEFVNAATSADNANAQPGAAPSAAGVLTLDQAGRFLRALCPLAPHLAEEAWDRMGLASRSGLIVTQTWPTVDAAMLVDDEVEVPISVGGKVRTRIMVPAAAAKDAKALEAAALAHPEVKAILDGKQLKKLIAVPGKMVNLVV